MLFFTFLSIVSLLITSVASTGYFLNPTGTDGSIILTEGDNIDISWTNSSDYNILSLGYFSTSNQTITWLISNSQSHPTSYSWTVDATQQGFNLADSHLFAFYICKNYNFGDPFMSSYVIINAGASSSSSSLSSVVSSSATSTTRTATSSTGTSVISPTQTTISSSSTSSTSLLTTTTPSNSATSTSTPTSSSSTLSQTSSKDDLSTGAKAGIALGAILGAVLIGILALLYVRRRRSPNQSPLHNTSNGPTEPDYDRSAYEKANSADMQQAAREHALTHQGNKYAPYTGVHEVPGSQGLSKNGGPVEIGSGQGDGRVELPAER